jgi:uncharacterized protein (DUF1330 family)
MDVGDCLSDQYPNGTKRTCRSCSSGTCGTAAGRRLCVRGGKFDVSEGDSRARNVVIEFPDYASALACYLSPEYQENIKLRLPHSTVDLIVIEGCDGPQP